MRTIFAEYNPQRNSILFQTFQFSCSRNRNKLWLFYLPGHHTHGSFPYIQVLLLKLPGLFLKSFFLSLKLLIHDTDLLFPEIPLLLFRYYVLLHKYVRYPMLQSVSSLLPTGQN